MTWIRKLIKKLTCKHEWKFVCNLYGDTINMHNKARSKWMCTKCGKIQYRSELYPEGKLFSQLLDREYDKFYQNRYENWKDRNIKCLEKLKQDMTDAAKRGECWLDIILFINEERNDRYYYDMFFNDLGLEFTRQLPEKRNDVYKLEYHIKWKN